MGKKKYRAEDDTDLTLVDKFLGGFRPIVGEAADGRMTNPRDEYLQQKANENRAAAQEAERARKRREKMDQRR